MPLFALLVGILTVITVPLQTSDTTGAGIGGKVRAFLFQSFLALFMGLMALWFLAAMASTGLGLVVFASMVLLLPLYALEIFWNMKSRRMTVFKLAVFPCLLASMIAFTVQRERKVVRIPEYSENASGDYVFERKIEAIPFGEQATLRLTEGFPKIEGSTSLAGMIRSLPLAIYATEQPTQYGWASKTPNAYTNLMVGNCDLVFAFYPSPEQLEAAEKVGRPFRLTPVGKEAFVFFVNPQNPVDNLSEDMLRNIYSGKITNWRDTGGPNTAITAFQRRKNSGSQSRMERFMAGHELMEPITEHRIWDMGGIVTHVARYRNDTQAIGYSFLYYIQNIIQGGDVQLLKINGVAPSLTTIRDETYPLTDEIYAIITDHSHPNAQRLVDWLVSPQGQRFVHAVGFAPLAVDEGVSARPQPQDGPEKQGSECIAHAAYARED